MDVSISVESASFLPDQGHAVYVLLSQAQSEVPHARASCSNVEHGVPPNCAGVTIERERDCEPPPHVTVHADQALKVLRTQSTGAGVGGTGVGGTGVGELHGFLH